MLTLKVTFHSPFNLCGDLVEQLRVPAPQLRQQLAPVHTLHAHLPDELVEDQVVDVLLRLDQFQQVVHLNI